MTTSHTGPVTAPPPRTFAFIDLPDGPPEMQVQIAAAHLEELNQALAQTDGSVLKALQRIQRQKNSSMRIALTMPYRAILDAHDEQESSRETGNSAHQRE